MPARPCPTCKKTNCGNHAACARRKLVECERCGKSPCFDEVHCLKTWVFWGTVALVERNMMPLLPKLLAEMGMSLDELSDEVLGELRKTTLAALHKSVMEEEHKKRLSMLTKFMFR